MSDIISKADLKSLAIKCRHWATQLDALGDSMQVMDREAIEANTKSVDLAKRNMDAFLAKANRKIFESE